VKIRKAMHLAFGIIYGILEGCSSVVQIKDRDKISHIEWLDAQVFKVSDLGTY